MGRSPRRPPADGIENWPGGLNDVADDPAVEVVRRIVLAVAEAAEGRSSRSVARDAGLIHQTVSDLRRGATWPEVATVVRLERALGVRLWPDDIDPSA